MLRKKLKNMEGITLVALVVTIVVLIILATVSINATIGKNGIITKAQKASELVEESRAKDDMGMYLLTLRTQKEEETGFRLADYLSENIGNEGIEDFLNNGDGYAQVTYKGYNFLVNLEDYTYIYLGKSDGTGVNRLIKQVLNNNNEDVPGIAMVEAGEIETEDLGWKVLSVNSDGTVNLIANRNTGFEVSLSGINGYTNGVKALNEICSKLYSGLEINGQKVLSARSVNYEDFYDVTYKVSRNLTSGQKIEPYINTLDSSNDGYSKDQITDYIDVSNTSGTQSSNTQMIKANNNPVTIKGYDRRTEKSTYSMLNTGNNYWLATRYAVATHDSKGGTVSYSEDVGYEVYYMNYVRTDGVIASNTLFQVNGYNTYGSNSTNNCSLRPVITVPASCISNTTVGTSVSTDPFYKGKTGEEAHGYVKADSIASLLGIDIKSVNKINSGLPTMETDMTWTKLTDGGYDSLTGEFDTSKYDYYIADRTTKLQMRLTGAPAYNNGVLAMDTVCNNLYGDVTEIKLSDGSTKKVNVVLARNAKFEDFYADTEPSGSYGGIWSTNASDDTAPNKITSTGNRYAPTLFAYEDIDASNGVSNGYSDAKISTYNLSTTGTTSFLSADQKSSYAYERYPEDPGLKVIYNYRSGSPNRNTSYASTGTDFWLSSRCVRADWNGASFYLRSMSSSGAFDSSYVFYSGTGTDSYCRGLRPVLQVSK